MTRQQLPIDYGEARQKRDAGMKASTAHADSVIPTWSERAIAFVHEFAVKTEFFPAEQVRKYAHNHGLPMPPDGRAWGTVMRTCGFRKWIRKTDRLMTSSDPKVHMNEVRVWQSLIFKA